MWGTEVRTEIEFNGSSGDFISQIAGFNNGAVFIDGVTPFSIRRAENPVEIWFRAEAAKGFGYITVQALPNDHALVRVSALDDEDWAALEKTWNLLASDLNEHGWIKESRNPEATKAKTGPRRYSEDRKIEAVRRWENLNRDDRAITLEDFLEEEFGQEGGTLKVAISTFYDWRRKYLVENNP